MIGPPAILPAPETAVVAWRREGSGDAAPWRFDRRCAARVRGTETLAMHESAGAGFGRRHVVTIDDRSAAGLGGVSQTPIMPGTSVILAAPGAIARAGTVVRCHPCGAGYRVGIALSRRRAA
jgi:hypothetical protein